MTEAQLWYADGLKFSCTGCGNCCTGSAGFTWVSEDEIDAAYSSKYARYPSIVPSVRASSLR